MGHAERVIRIEALAPAKPAPGAPCNGCGVCCLYAPCPLGIVLSGRRSGACAVLRWLPSQRQYRCGALAEPVGVVRERLPSALSPLAPGIGAVLRRLASRWIAAGTGCDCSLEVASPLKVDV